MKPLTVASILEGVSYLKDHSLSLRFSTKELSSADKVMISDYHGEYGFLLFKPNIQIKESEIPEDNAPSDDSKTPAQRLRSVLSALHKRMMRTDSFEAYYRKTMERILEGYKDKLGLVCLECGSLTKDGKCTCKAGDRL